MEVIVHCYPPFAGEQSMTEGDLVSVERKTNPYPKKNLLTQNCKV